MVYNAKCRQLVKITMTSVACSYLRFTTVSTQCVNWYADEYFALSKRRPMFSKKFIKYLETTGPKVAWPVDFAFNIRNDIELKSTMKRKGRMKTGADDCGLPIFPKREYSDLAPK